MSDYKALRKVAGEAARSIAYICRTSRTAADPVADLRARLGVVARVLLNELRDDSSQQPSEAMDTRSASS